VTPAEAAAMTWAEDPRLMTDKAAAAIAPALLGSTGGDEKGREAA
jgi:hypothetical protein